ncbi:MAG TPA: hypothetical protein VNO30_41330 [Kofleriaceae bacterium]|nr:hypothetical protein [Kofleriaceae bacterium]
MKWIFAWLGLAALIALAVAGGSCSINHKSGRYTCSSTSDCEAGRVCTDGVCVVGTDIDAPPIDAPQPDAPPDSTTCPSQCTRCMPGNVCVIDCAAGADCSAKITCPTGYNCDVRCTTDNSCRSGVDCTNAASCTFQCTGVRSCRGITCGAGACTLSCTGNNSCESVNCGTSCACDVRCGAFGNGACMSVTCTDIACDTGRGCSATINPVCDTCP